MSEWTEDPGNAARIAAAEARGDGAPDYLKYIQMNPGLREATEAQGMTQAEVVDFAKWHWTAHGEDEFAGGAGGRLNTPFETQIPTEITAQPNPTDIAGFEEFIQGSATQPLSEMWAARAAVDPAWNVGQFSGEGWNFDPDNPYARGILGDTIAVDAPVGQLMDTGDPRFLQDRYQDPSIAQDFPVGWTTPENIWAGPEQLGGYWDALTNAERNAAGEIRSVVDRPAAGWAGPSVAPGTRGGGNVRGGGPPNPTVPSFGYPQYQDWTRFMPTNFQLAEGGGMHYQPWATGTPQGGGGNFVARPDPVFTTGGGGTTATGGPGPINPNIWGNTDTTSSSNTTTDSSGNRWVMSPGGQWYRADSDYGQGLLGTGRLFYDQHYDSSGNYVGAEGLSSEEQGVNWAADAHEAMYPGSQQMASDAGFGLLTANRFNPAYRDYRQSNINDMVRLGVSNVLPGATTYNSQNWRDLQTARAADWNNPNVGVQPAASVMPNLAAEIDAMMDRTSSGPNTGPSGRPGY